MPLTNRQQEPYEKTKIACNCKKKFGYKYTNYNSYRKVEGHCHYTGEYRETAHNISKLKKKYT